MIQLPNDCKRSELSVFPKNWKSKSADLSLTWYIKYRFYAGDQSKQIVLKGFAIYKTLAERQEAIRDVLKVETDQLKQGYNPILKGIQSPVQTVSGKTTLIKGLNIAMNALTLEVETKRDIKSVLKYVEAGAMSLGISDTMISTITRKHIKLLLEETGRLKLKNKKVWNENQYNHYRKYLSLLFSELMELEVVEYNPIINKQIRKKPQVKKLRDTLTDEQCLIVDKHLYDNYYSFWRFMKIFYFSGAREIELLRVKREDINLFNQTFKVTIKKGKDRKEVRKAIHAEVLELWKELYFKSKAGQIIFSCSLMPGNKTINREQLSRRWKSHVKDKLGIEADLYSLKHHFLDKVTKYEGIEKAQALANHNSKATTEIYAIKEGERELERMKTIPIAFGL